VRLKLQLIAGVQDSGGMSIVIVEHSTQPFVAPHPAAGTSMTFVRDDQSVPETLVVSLTVMLEYELMDSLAQRILKEEGFTRSPWSTALAARRLSVR
jgi:hypothetical protein